MGSAILTKSLYSIYNLLQKGKLNRLYEDVKKVNDRYETFDKKKISHFLKKWGFNSQLEQNQLMNKKDIIAWSKKVKTVNIHDWAYTGGSYGEPLRVPYSKNRALIRTATFKYFNELGGYKIGDPYVLIRAKEKPTWLKFLRNETIFIPEDISEENLEKLFSFIKKKNITLLLGYPTVMYELVVMASNRPNSLKNHPVKTVITTSESIEMHKRSFINQILECNLIDRYANEEVGLIAQQKEFGGDYYVNKYGIYTEIIDPKSLQPVEEGEIGKVVVTDLTNDLIPVLRYDTGDLAIASKYENGELLSIKKIIGRESEQIFTTNGKPVASLMLGPHIYKPLAKTGDMHTYQFAQLQEDKYELRIKTGPENLSQDYIKMIVSGLRKVLGSDAEIKLKYVDHIAPLPSGKRPIYTNEMN